MCFSHPHRWSLVSAMNPQPVFSTTHEAKYTSSPWRHTRSPSRAGECANWSAPYKIRAIVLTPGHSFTVPKNSTTTPPGLRLGTQAKWNPSQNPHPRLAVAGLLHAQAFQRKSLAVGRHASAAIYSYASHNHIDGDQYMQHKAAGVEIDRVRHFLQA